MTPTSFDSERTKSDSLIYTLYFRNCRFSFQYRLHPVLQICIACLSDFSFYSAKSTYLGTNPHPLKYLQSLTAFSSHLPYTHRIFSASLHPSFHSLWIHQPDIPMKHSVQMPAHMPMTGCIIHSVILNLAYISNTGIYSFRHCSCVILFFTLSSFTLLPIVNFTCSPPFEI